MAPRKPTGTPDLEDLFKPFAGMVPDWSKAMAGFGHAISEVGSALIVGGNIHGQTQVMTTSIVEQVRKGDFNDALVYAGILLALAFMINAVLTSVQQRAASWAQS